MKPLISIAEADRRILESIQPAPTETVPLAEAHQRILQTTIKSDRAIPAFNRSMMDGIAIHSDEFTGIGSVFTIEGTQAAGSPQLKKNMPDSCFEIMTGAPVPSGCDCVIPNKYIHAAGSDCQLGDTVLSPSSQLHAPELAIAASVGATNIKVSKLPNITILTSGDEVISPSETPLPYQLRSSHPSALTAALNKSKLGNVTHQHIPDDKDATLTTLKQCFETSDWIILTGGVSKGKFDYIAPALEEFMGEPTLHGIKQRPGKPLGFWKTPTSPYIFALPGNPVSVMTTAARYLIPSLKKHLGHPSQPQARVLAEPANWSAAIPGFLPVAQLPDATVKPLYTYNSGDFLSLATCTGFIECSLPKHTIPAGATLPYFPL